MPVGATIETPGPPGVFSFLEGDRAVQSAPTAHNLQNGD